MSIYKLAPESELELNAAQWAHSQGFSNPEKLEGVPGYFVWLEHQISEGIIEATEDQIILVDFYEKAMWAAAELNEED
jgi:hypothetical protein